MDVEESYELHKNSTRMTLFGFELNRSQTSLFLILSLIGIFMLPFTLAGEIFLNLFQFLFSILPDYLSEPERYHEGYLVYYLSPIIIRIIIYTIFLLSSIYILRKILKYNNIKKKNKNNSTRKNNKLVWVKNISWTIVIYIYYIINRNFLHCTNIF
jgi:Ca2+/H+ antiporter